MNRVEPAREKAIEHDQAVEKEEHQIDKVAQDNLKESNLKDPPSAQGVKGVHPQDEASAKNIPQSELLDR